MAEKMLKASDIGAAIYYKLRADYLQKIPYGNEFAVKVDRDPIMGEMGLREDHIAFRAFYCATGEIPPGVVSIERIFTPLGWKRGVDANGKEYNYDFPNMKVRAIHLEYPEDRPDLPKMFISELLVDQLEKADADKIKADLADTKDPLTPEDKIWLQKLSVGELIPESMALGLIDRAYKALGRPWQPPHRSTVLQTNERTQYAAWTLLNGPMNHTAYLTADLNATAEAHRKAGRELLPSVMGSKEKGLLQTSVRSPMFDFEVTEDEEGNKVEAGVFNYDVREDDGSLGKIRWTGPFAEIIERPLADDGKRYEAFLPENAAHIFAATRNKEVKSNKDQK
jgi:hypothetical protein